VSFGKLFWHNFDAKPTENAYTKAYDQQRAKALRDLDSPKYLSIPVTPTAPMKAKPLGELMVKSLTLARRPIRKWKRLRFG
jgi:hypothetical protein